MSIEINIDAGEVLDGLSLWEEHKPQSGEDWVAVAERFIAAGDTTEDSSPLFAGLVLAVRQRDAEAERLRNIIGGLYVARGGSRHELYTAIKRAFRASTGAD